VDTAAVMLLPPPPSRVWMGGYEWRLEGVHSTDKRLSKCFGMTYFDEVEDGATMFTCYYAVDRPAREVFDTVWHELTHALNHAHGLTLKSTSVRKNDEAIASKHGYAWTQAFLDNPALVHWIGVAVPFIKSQQENVEA
jgi:hypothetical protein